MLSWSCSIVLSLAVCKRRHRPACDTGAGREPTTYDESYFEGRVYSDALNTPSQYIYGGDWVASATEDTIVTLKEDAAGDMVPTNPTVRLDIGFGLEDAE
jgi:hypothetical protein